MRPFESLLRGSGHYGPATHTDNADPVDRLMAFVGRDVGSVSAERRAR